MARTSPLALGLLHRSEWVAVTKAHSVKGMRFDALFLLRYPPTEGDRQTLLASCPSGLVVELYPGLMSDTALLSLRHGARLFKYGTHWMSVRLAIALAKCTPTAFLGRLETRAGEGDTEALELLSDVAVANHARFAAAGGT